MDKKSVTRENDPLHGLCMLLGQDGEDWIYYETDPGWWTLRLWIGRN